MMSLGLALIFGMLNIINFTHGAQYMMGAFAAWMLLNYAGVSYWVALVLALLIEGALRQKYGGSGQPFQIPDSLSGGTNLGFMFLPNYRIWVISASLGVCLAIWYVIERTRLGSYLRAGTENPVLVQAFGINIRRMITLTYMLGAGLAAFAGVLAAPIYQVSSIMGANIIPIIFSVVVIGGMGSIMGSIITGFVLGLIDAFTRLIYPEASAVVIFVVMVAILLIRPQGLFGVRS